MSAFLLLFVILGVVSGHLFGFLRYYLYLRTLRHLTDQYGLAALPFASTFASTSSSRGAGLEGTAGERRLGADWSED